MDMKKHYLVFFSLALIFGFVIGATVNGYAQEAKTKEKMKFLVIAEPKDIYYSMSASDRKKIVDAASENAKKEIKSGSTLELYSIPGWHRYVSIEQYGSIEELYNHFEGDPNYPYFKFEVYPLQIGDIQTDEAKKAKPDAKMKFLVIVETKDIWYSIPADERKKIEDGNNDYMSQLAKAGDFLEVYDMPGWNRTIAIEQYRSIEELHKHFEGFPGYPYSRYEVYPLFTIDIKS
jgi:muconolactone delta-isomerase